MNERAGVAIALLSSSLGGGAAVATRFLIAGVDPLTLATVQALRYASPTRVANTITINPLIAMAAATLLLGEPVTVTLVLGLVAVGAGVWVATT